MGRRPFKGEKTPGSGRKKGTPNKTISPLKERAEVLGIDPFEILLYFAAGNKAALNLTEDIPAQVRAKAAAEACQYLHPKLKAIEHSGDKDNPIHLQTQLIILPSNGRESKDD